MRNILLCACGLTPQVITETLYALSIKKNPAWIPHEIHAVTTESGRLLIEEKLLHPTQGRFHAFCSEYNIPAPSFDASTVHVIASSGEPVHDIRSLEDNSALADGMVQIVKTLCERPETRVHASLAGGRKTMSFYMGMAMQLFARESDVLSHVLVHPPFENHPDFFYPPRVPREYTVFDSTSGRPYTVNSSQAEIELAFIPFIRLRDFAFWSEDSSGFFEHVAAVQSLLKQSAAPCLIKFDPDTLHLAVNQKEIVLTPTEGALYLLLMRRKLQCQMDGCLDCKECWLDPYELDIEFIYRFLLSRWGRWSRRADEMHKRLSSSAEIKSWFLQHRSRINRKLRVVDPTGQAAITGTGNYGNKRYALAADKKQLICTTE